MRLFTSTFLLSAVLLAASALSAPPREIASSISPLSVPGNPSPLFALRVNGVNVPVVGFKDIHYAHFTMTDTAQVEVLLKTGTVTFENVHWNYARVPVRIDLPKALRQFALDAKKTPLIEDVRFVLCTRAGKPVKAPEDAGFCANEDALTAGFTFD